MRLGSALMALLLFVGASFAQDRPIEMMAKEARNKAVARRVFEEIFNQGKFQVADEIYARDFKNHGLHGSIDLKTDQDAVHAEKLAFPDLRMSVDELMAEGDLVTARWTFRGTHTAGGYGGLPPTGARVEMQGITVWRIVDGKICDEWSSFDELGSYAQVVAHLKWKLLAALIALLALFVIFERLAWGVLKKVHFKLKRRSL